MALSVCIACKRAFIGGVKEEKICPGCDVRLRELYPSVRSFLRNNDRKIYTVQDVSRIMGIALGDVAAMVSMGLVETHIIKRKAADEGKAHMLTHSRKKKTKTPGGRT